MNYITIALLAEAAYLIEDLSLQKSDDKIFPIYENSTIKLIVSGIGKVDAAAATIYLLQKYHATKEDKVFNIGMCTTTQATIMIGDFFIINKLIDSATNSVYHLPKEGKALTCVDKALDSNRGLKTPLADMESVGVYLAAKRFIQNEHIYIAKIVSDKTDSTILQKEEIKALFAQHQKTIRGLLV